MCKVCFSCSIEMMRIQTKLTLKHLDPSCLLHISTFVIYSLFLCPFALFCPVSPLIHLPVSLSPFLSLSSIDMPGGVARRQQPSERSEGRRCGSASWVKLASVLSLPLSGSRVFSAAKVLWRRWKMKLVGCSLLDVVSSPTWVRSQTPAC